MLRGEISNKFLSRRDDFCDTWDWNEPPISRYVPDRVEDYLPSDGEDDDDGDTEDAGDEAGDGVNVKDNTNANLDEEANK